MDAPLSADALRIRDVKEVEVIITAITLQGPNNANGLVRSM